MWRGHCLSTLPSASLRASARQAGSARVQFHNSATAPRIFPASRESLITFSHTPALRHPPRPPRISLSADPETAPPDALHGRVSPSVGLLRILLDGLVLPTAHGKPDCPKTPTPRPCHPRRFALYHHLWPAHQLLGHQSHQSQIQHIPPTQRPIHPDSPFWGNKNSQNQIAPSH